MTAKRTTGNPFSVVSYMGPEYFCDRVSETETLRHALANRRNITLISPRRMGKTGLIHHLFRSIAPTEAYCFYIDIYNTTSLYDFTKRFAEEVLTRRIASFGQQVWIDIQRIFGALRPTLTLDAVTGMPQCTVDIQPQHEEATLRQVFEYLEQAALPCYVAFDEFQVIEEYTDCKMEATLRSYIQHLNNVRFIFSGSKKHVLLQLFASVKRPFYQSTQIIEIGVIDETAYYDFAAAHLSHHGQQIDRDTFHELYTMVNGHTWYMQSLLNRLYQSAVPKIEYADCMAVVNDIIQENISVFQTYMSLVTARQREVLRAVAKEGCIRDINSNRFLTLHKLPSGSTVRSAVLVLEEKELLFRDRNGYSVYDRFFAIWLRMASSSPISG